MNTAALDRNVECPRDGRLHCLRAQVEPHKSVRYRRDPVPGACLFAIFNPFSRILVGLRRASGSTDILGNGTGALPFILPVALDRFLP
jgi:hypothetical protein